MQLKMRSSVLPAQIDITQQIGQRMLLASQIHHQASVRAIRRRRYIHRRNAQSPVFHREMRQQRCQCMMHPLSRGSIDIHALGRCHKTIALCRQRRIPMQTNPVRPRRKIHIALFSGILLESVNLIQTTRPCDLGLQNDVFHRRLPFCTLANSIRPLSFYHTARRKTISLKLRNHAKQNRGIRFCD